MKAATNILWDREFTEQEIILENVRYNNCYFYNCKIVGAKVDLYGCCADCSFVGCELIIP